MKSFRRNEGRSGSPSPAPLHKTASRVTKKRLKASEITVIVGGRALTSDKIKGKGKEVIGAGKEKLGEMTGDERLQAEGRSQNVEGKVQKAVGRVKDKATEIKRKVT